MNLSTFNSYRKLVYENSGIKLSDGKEALVCARIGKRMRELGITDHQEYLRHIIRDESGQEIIHLLDAVSTNVTSFFREPDHFHFLEEILKKWVLSGQERLRIWSAACSSGEEPYSIAMTVLEAIGDIYDTKILATDISTRTLERARRGIYEASKMEQIPKILRERHFQRSNESGSPSYIAEPALRNMIAFRRLNLSDPPFPMRGPLDLVFCRNVMIYLDYRVRQGLLREVDRLLKPGGYLIVGHAESLVGLMSGFKPIQPSVYARAG